MQLLLALMIIRQFLIMIIHSYRYIEVCDIMSVLRKWLLYITAYLWRRLWLNITDCKHKYTQLLSIRLTWGMSRKFTRWSPEKKEKQSRIRIMDPLWGESINRLSSKRASDEYIRCFPTLKDYWTIELLVIYDAVSLMWRSGHLHPIHMHIPVG